MAGTWSRKHGDHCLLPHSHTGLLSASFPNQDHLPREGAHSGPSPPTSINNQDCYPQTCTHTSLVWEIPQLRLLSQMTLVCQVNSYI